MLTELLRYTILLSALYPNDLKKSIYSTKAVFFNPCTKPEIQSETVLKQKPNKCLLEDCIEHAQGTVKNNQIPSNTNNSQQQNTNT